MRAEEAMKNEGDDNNYCNWCNWNDPQIIGKEAGRIRNQRTSEKYPNYSIIKIGQNTKKSPGNLWRLVIT